MPIRGRCLTACRQRKCRVVTRCSRACSRSGQSSSAGSSPTESRSRPSGTRSPSQRWRVSIVEWTPPRLVALTISCRRGLDPPRRAPSATSNEMQCRRSRDSGRSRPPRAPRAAPPSVRRRLGLARDADLERLQAAQQQPGGVGRGDDPGARPELAQARGVLGALRRRRRRAARRGGRRGTSSPSGGRGRSRARAGAGAPASPRSRRRRRGRGAPRPPRSRASSGAGSTAPRSRRGRRPAGGGPVWSKRTCRSPQRSSSVEEDAGAVVARPAASAIVAPGWSSASTSAVVAPIPDEKRSASPPSSSPSCRSASTPAGCAFRA